MKQFISVKNKHKLSKYYVLGIFILIIIIINIFISIYMENNTYILSNLLYKNAYGLNHNLSPYYLLYKNAFGLNFNYTKVMNTYDNSTELTISKPIIYIYNTFQTAKYKSAFTNKYNINPVITQASLILQDYLKREGIYSIVEKASVVKISQDNDIPYTKSYRGSRILLEMASLNNPSLEYFIDIQMSNSEEEAITINNLKYAKILFVIGTEFSSYKENAKLALALNNIIENNYKDLSLGLDYRGGEGYHGVYNEDFSANVLMIEIGSKENTIDEVNRSLQVLASALAQYIKEESI